MLISSREVQTTALRARTGCQLTILQMSSELLMNGQQDKHSYLQHQFLICVQALWPLWPLQCTVGTILKGRVGVTG